MEQTLLPNAQNSLDNKPKEPKERLLQVSSPVLVGEVHPQDDVLLRVLVAAGVDHHHVANPLGPPALQAHGLWESVKVTSARRNKAEETLIMWRGRH